MAGAGGENCGRLPDECDGPTTVNDFHDTKLNA